MKSKKKIALAIVLLLVLIAAVIFAIKYITWSKYNNNFINTYGSILDSTKSTVKFKDEGNEYSVFLENQIYSLEEPNFLKYDGYVYLCNSYPFDSSAEEDQYEVNVYVYLQKDGSKIWKITIDQIKNQTELEYVYSGTIDPETYEIISTEFSLDDSKDYVSLCREYVKKAILDTKNFFEF